MSDITIEAAARWLPADLDGLRCEADDEGIGIVGVVIDRWVDGTQRYDVPGESLLVAVRPPGVAVAVGGLSWCPNVAEALRVRRFYVSPTMRRHGVARELATRLIDGARNHTSKVTCNAQASASAPPFWESLGFAPVVADGVTHVLDLSAPCGRR